jgi:FAD synthetase
VIGSAVHTALDVLDDALRLYGPEQVYSSYNGGKDAVVIMHLLRASVAKYSSDKGEAHRPMLVYFAVSDEFPEVLEFIAESEDQYGVEVRRSNSSIVKGLAEIIESKALAGSSSHLAFVLGTRRGDPNCGDQSFFSPSSKWMPPFMRVNPILHWTYGQVWHFLRSNGLAYCKLYDLGYTSLGKRADTRPNPALKKNKFSMGTAGQEGDEYFPAHMLADFALERSGRGAAKDPSAVPPMSADGRMHVESAGMIIIGDEILSGFTTESNLMITSTALGGVGVPLKRVAVVSDDEDEIVKEVRRMSQEYDIVITSGGIGPTHDDVTIKVNTAWYLGSIFSIM